MQLSYYYQTLYILFITFGGAYNCNYRTLMNCSSSSRTTQGHSLFKGGKPKAIFAEQDQSDGELPL